LRAQIALAYGTKLGTYEIIASLGVGGMGEVYPARDVRLDRNFPLWRRKPDWTLWSCSTPA